jgi:hypothetical protein
MYERRPSNFAWPSRGFAYLAKWLKLLLRGFCSRELRGSFACLDNRLILLNFAWLRVTSRGSPYGFPLKGKTYPLRTCVRGAPLPLDTLAERPR